MQEALEPNPFAYPTYNDFFGRQLKPECRPIDDNPNSIVSPADGNIAQIGTIAEQKILQAKKHYYTLNSLLANDSKLAATFMDGNFATIYLAPKDYHRIHMPVAGQLKKMLHVPGKLFSVNPVAAENIPDLFARNERVITIFDTEFGPMAVILVGAMIVGSIQTVWHGVITPPHKGTIRKWDYANQDISLAKGAELGRFKLGSTVILLLPKGLSTWDAQLQMDSTIQMGRKLGEISAR